MGTRPMPLARCPVPSAQRVSLHDIADTVPLRLWHGCMGHTYPATGLCAGQLGCHIPHSHGPWPTHGRWNQGRRRAFHPCRRGAPEPIAATRGPPLPSSVALSPPGAGLRRRVARRPRTGALPAHKGPRHAVFHASGDGGCPVPHGGLATQLQPQQQQRKQQHGETLAPGLVMPRSARWSVMWAHPCQRRRVGRLVARRGAAEAKHAHHLERVELSLDEGVGVGREAVLGQPPPHAVLCARHGIDSGSFSVRAPSGGPLVLVVRCTKRSSG